MAVPASGPPALPLPGNLEFLAGGMASRFLTGRVVLDIDVPSTGPNAGNLVVVVQHQDSTVETLAFSFTGGGMPVVAQTAVVIWAASATPAEAEFGSPVAIDEAMVPAYPANPPNPLYLVAWRSGATPADFTMTVGGTPLIVPLGQGLGATYSDFTINGVAGRLSYYQTTPGFFAQLFAGQRAVFT